MCKEDRSDKNVNLNVNTRPDSSTPNSPSFFDATNHESAMFDLADTIKIFDSRNLPVDFGKYRLVESIGAGGVGVVFRASENTNTGSDTNANDIAVKLIRPDIMANVQAVRRFEKEARLLSSVDSPFIPRFHEFGCEQGVYFLANEFVQGVGLNEVIGPLKTQPVEQSLRIIIDVLKALSAMHSMGLIHRDVKPGNILVKYGSQHVVAGTANYCDFEIAKLTDFGLARHVKQSESLAMTRQRAILGTPLYMAPEQHAESRSVDARADIYSVGVTLFEMISGRVPFESRDINQLAEMHRIERPVALRQLRAGVSDAVNNVVMKSLEKQPNLRYQHAEEMLIDIERILNDHPISIRLYPEIPKSENKSTKRFEFQWILATTPKQLWPLIADTDRFNRAIGLPAPNFIYDRSGTQRRVFAEANFNGMSVRWLEHPFQWICEREMSVLREFEAGPFKWVTSTVELQPLVNRKTRLIHRFQAEPRGFFGKLLLPFQFNFLTKRTLNRVYKRLEQIANDQTCAYACDAPFTKTSPLSAQQQRLLQDRAEKLSQLHGDRSLAESFARFIETVADPFVARIRPVSLGQKLACSSNEALRLCLNGVDAGLVNLTWDIICPVCRIAASNASKLGEIASHEKCEVCNLEFKIDFSKSVEAVFAVHPEVRSVEMKTYCIGGPFHAPHVLAQNRLLAGQHVDIGAKLSEGYYLIRGPQLGDQPLLAVQNEATESRVCVCLGRNESAGETKLCPGDVCVSIRNESDTEVLVRLEKSLDRGNTITAADAAEHPIFRRLFPDEVASVEQLVNVNNVYLLGIRLCSAESLLESIGDMKVRSMWDQVQSLLTTVQSSCKVIECSHDCLIASFETLDDLLIHFVSLVTQADKNIDLPIRECTFVINNGQVMTSQQLGQPTTFGKTVRRNKKILDGQPTRRVAVSEEIYSQMGSPNSDSLRLLRQVCSDPEHKPGGEIVAFVLY